VGVKHVKFWTVAGNQLIGKRGVLTDAGTGTDIKKMQTMLSIGFGAVSLHTLDKDKKMSMFCIKFTS